MVTCLTMTAESTSDLRRALCGGIVNTVMTAKDRTLTGWLSDALADRGFEDMDTDTLLEMAVTAMGEDKAHALAVRLSNTMYQVGATYLCGVCADLSLVRDSETTWRPCPNCNNGTPAAAQEEF